MVAMEAQELLTTSLVLLYSMLVAVAVESYDLSWNGGTGGSSVGGNGGGNNADGF
jgi:hypothetical protein